MLFTQDIRKRLEVTKNALFSICRERERERETRERERETKERVNKQKTFEKIDNLSVRSVRQRDHTFLIKLKRNRRQF